MRPQRTLIVGQLLSMTLLACGPMTQGGSGVFVTEARALEGFTKISASGSFKVHLKKGPLSALELSGDDNIVPLIRTEVVNGVLTIDFDLIGSERRTEPYLAMTVPKLDSIKALSSVHAWVEGLEGDSVTLEARDTAHLQLSNVNAKSAVVLASEHAIIDGAGMNAKNLTLKAHGASIANFRYLPASEVTVSATDRACVTATAEQMVSGDAHGASVVEVSGMPPMREVTTSDSAVAQFMVPGSTPSSCAVTLQPVCNGVGCEVEEEEEEAH